MATHPEVAAHARAEVDAVAKGAAPTIAETRALHYLEAIALESLQLRPPGPQRMLESETDVGGGDVVVRAGVMVMFMPRIRASAPLLARERAHAIRLDFCCTPGMARRSTLRLHMRFDFRRPAFAPPAEELYAVALDQVAWADALGFETVIVSEHHGSDDGYLPSPLVVAAAFAARTRRVRIRTSALVLPLHDPVRVAEDAAIVDILSGGRLELVVAAGYVPAEFAMFGRSLRDRSRALEEGIAVLDRAWSGEAFDYQGRRVRVTPRPVQRPRPPILLGGGTVASAERAARIADGYVPVVPSLFKVYEEACARLGRAPAKRATGGALFLHLADDPDAAWARLGPHILHDLNAYADWAAQAGVPSPFRRSDDVAEVRRAGAYQIMTPAECLANCRSLRDGSFVVFHPMLGGIPPAVAQESLDLFAREVWAKLDP